MTRSLVPFGEMAVGRLTKSVLHQLFFLALYAALLLACPPPVLRAATFIIPVASQLDRGWYNSIGDAAPTNTTFGVGGNYTVGMAGTEVRNFFIFQIPQITEPLIHAELVLYVTPPEDGGYSSPDPTESLELFSLDYFSADVLRRRDTNEASIAIFEDLGDGVAYSEPSIVTPTNQNSDITIPLNSAFLSAVTNHLGRPLALGGRLTSLRLYPEVMEFLFGYSHHVPFERTYLILKTPAIRRLDITRNPDFTLTLSFPVEFADHLVESTDSPANPAWTPVLQPREQFDDTIYITLDDTNPSHQFFRLRSPP